MSVRLVASGGVSVGISASGSGVTIKGLHISGFPTNGMGISGSNATVQANVLTGNGRGLVMTGDSGTFGGSF